MTIRSMDSNTKSETVVKTVGGSSGHLKGSHTVPLTRKVRHNLNGHTSDGRWQPPAVTGRSIVLWSSVYLEL